ncbi:plasmid recombination protein [Streptomyces sp. MBT56]|uniref:plasmid recombination protein n=1 Tax=Streptomyces sp. MBT56 TaxID=1488387 RepID=UPI001909F4A3|nr:plasmid recombination protein [Streptomyces sp. MBT56]MBK3558074.1 plasmid recombination protein [Streptomyces sp. MBT56]
MSENHVMMHREKIKARRPVRELMKEYFRDEENAHKYENGVRNIDIEKTRNNYALVEPPSPKELDRLRRERFDLIDKRRRENGQRGLRKDTVDSLMTIVQTGGVFIENMTRDEQIKFFEDVVDVMREDPDTYGKIDAAVIHFDETTPHMQVLTSTLDFENNRSNAKRMMGNQIKMSVDQTNFVKSVQAKGYEVERGKNTFADNYQEWKKEAEQKYKIKINRHNEHLINELEERETQIDMAETQTKEEVIEDLKTFYPSVKFKYNPKTNKGKVVGTNSENYHSEDLHHFNEDESVNTLKQLNIERLLKLKEVAREKQLRTEKEEQERKEKEIEEREAELNERDELLNNREDDLNEKEQGLNDRENTVVYREQGLEQKEEDFDKRLREKEESFNEMYERPTYYAFCEDLANGQMKALQKQNPNMDVKEVLFRDFKVKSSLVGSDGDRKIKRAKKDLSVGDEKPTVEKSKTSEKEKGFEFE